MTVILNQHNHNPVQSGNISVQALGIHRFRIDRVLHRALDGLILTCEVTNFIEEGSDVDEKLSESTLFQTLWTDAIEFCKICQKTYSSTRHQIFQ